MGVSFMAQQIHTGAALFVSADLDDEQRLERRIWRTIDGHQLPVRRMTDDHLINCINMLLRNKQAGDDWELLDYWLDVLQREAARRGV